MKRKREISIKSPSLRAIRNSFREILYLEWSKRSRAIIHAQSALLDTKISQNDKLRMHGELQAKLGENRIIIKPTIIMCGWCHHRDKDAIYSPSSRQWFCPSCYNEHKEDILSAESFIY